MRKRFRVKNYQSLVRKAPVKVKAKGRVRVKSCYGGGYGGSYGGQGGSYGGQGGGQQMTSNPFVGPSFQQRLFGWALASTLVTVDLEANRFRGRVISVDQNGFEMSVTDPMNSGFTPGSIVFVSFSQVNAIAAS